MAIREKVFLPIHLIDRESTDPLIFLTYEEANLKYDVNFNRIFYNNILESFMNICLENNIFVNPFDPLEPIYPTVSEILLKNLKGCSFWSKLIKHYKNDDSNINARHLKWENKANLPPNIINWQNKRNYKLNISY